MLRPDSRSFRTTDFLVLRQRRCHSQKRQCRPDRKHTCLHFTGYCHYCTDFDTACTPSAPSAPERAGAKPEASAAAISYIRQYWRRGACRAAFRVEDDNRRSITSITSPTALWRRPSYNSKRAPGVRTSPGASGERNVKTPSRCPSWSSPSKSITTLQCGPPSQGASQPSNCATAEYRCPVSGISLPWSAERGVHSMRALATLFSSRPSR